MKEIILKYDFKDRIVFHFNKQHLIDSNIPMWVLKHKGNTYYVNHVNFESGINFSTKETPENEHTKGSILIKGKLEIYKENNIITGRIY